MSGRLITLKQDLTYLRWSHVRISSGTAGTFLKSESMLEGKKRYYKLSNYDPQLGVIGHECINEYVVDRLLDVLGVAHLNYDLIHADIEIEGSIYETYLCASQDYKERGESKIALDDFFRVNTLPKESHYDFCVRNGWRDAVDAMIVIDYIILNRDRHGANIEVLRNSREKTLRLAPLFDHGLSLLCTCMSEEEIAQYDVLEDRKCQSFFGGLSAYENLARIGGRKDVFSRKLKQEDRKCIFDGLDGVLSDIHMNKMWDMIYERYKTYENL